MKPKRNESKQDFLKRCTQAAMAGGNDQQAAFASCNLDWDMSKNTRSGVTLSAPVELAKGKTDDEARPFMITAYTGAAIQRYWGKLVFDLAGMQAKKKIPVLREHYRDRVVGFGCWKRKKKWKP